MRRVPVPARRRGAPFLPAILTLILAAGPAAGQTRPPEPTTGARIAELQRSGRAAEALDLLSNELAARPGDALLLYNRACLENRLGRVDEAVASLQAALAAGFDDLAHAVADPDLRQGDGAARLAEVLARHRQSRAALGARRGATLTLGRPVTLALAPLTGEAPDGARVTLTWEETGLDLRLEAPDEQGRWLPAAGATPWTGQGGLVVVIGPLSGDDSGETEDAFVFGFGLEKDAGVGAVHVAAAAGWQRVRELEPKVRGAGTAQLVIDAMIPWNAVAPYHPLVDPVLGVNVALVGRGGAAGPSLVPGTPLARSADARHLGARLAFDTNTAAAGSLHGRVVTSVITGGQTTLELVAVGGRPGPATLSLDFQDGDGHSLLEGRTAPQPVQLGAGATALAREVDFSRLRPGPCRVSAELALPDGGVSSWSTWLLNLGPRWRDGYREAIAALPADERPTANFYLARVAEAVDGHRARRDPGPLTTTLGDLNLMLARFAKGGSLVPAAGLAPFVFPGPNGEDRLCHLVLPPGRPAGSSLQPVIVAGHAAGDSPRLAERMLRHASADTTRPTAGTGSWPVFIVAPGQTGGGWALATAEAELAACATWARSRFAGPPLLLAAQRQAVAPALALASAPGGGLGALLVVGDGALDPWPGQDAGAVAGRVGPPPAGLAVTWLDFAQETGLQGGARTLAAALRRAGWDLRVETVRGGANYTQVADRICRWLTALGDRSR